MTLCVLTCQRTARRELPWTGRQRSFNSVGVGAFFNLMSLGQMLKWHIALIPIMQRPNSAAVISGALRWSL
jgi:hypothetical protein